jgi:hypothetical protein
MDIELSKSFYINKLTQDAVILLQFQADLIICEIIYS